MSDKQVRGKYTQEYKLEAVRQVEAGQSIAMTVKVVDYPLGQHFIRRNTTLLT